MVGQGLVYPCNRIVCSRLAWLRKRGSYRIRSSFRPTKFILYISFKKRRERGKICKSWNSMLATEKVTSTRNLRGSHLVDLINLRFAQLGPDARNLWQIFFVRISNLLSPGWYNRGPDFCVFLRHVLLIKKVERSLLVQKVIHTEFLIILEGNFWIVV